MEGKIGGDSDLSERGFRYSRALPDLIKDNIGDAPLTVTISPLNALPNVMVTLFVSGLDFHPQTHDANGARIAVYQVDLEVAGRA